MLIESKCTLHVKNKGEPDRDDLLMFLLKKKLVVLQRKKEKVLKSCLTRSSLI